MVATPDRSNRFILQVFDCTMWCPIAHVPFHVADIDGLRSILGLAADEDPKLECFYPLDDEQSAVIVSAYATFDPRQIDGADHEIWLSRLPEAIETPYLVHTGYELPLLLEDRKKLARFSYAYPREAFDGEEAFDRWVANGVLHNEVVDEPFEKPIGGLLGHRTVYYTPKGEEWRVPAHKLIERASGKSGGWNEHFERLEGMLFGYEDWQNDWWINARLERGAFGGATYCCAVTAAGLAWAESSGLRAVPPIEAFLPVRVCWRTSDADLQEFLQQWPESVAVLRFTVGAHAVAHIIDHSHGGPWKVRGHQIPELNKHMTGAIVVVARRGQSN